MEGKYREAIDAFEKVRARNPDAVEAVDGVHFAIAYAAQEDRAP